MGPAFVVDAWVAVNVVCTLALVALGVLPRASRWTNRDDLQLAQWSRASSKSD
ncbi:MAG: hypothetical protein QOK39_2648 [Acidimicrobiaceae bacterium]|jgi:hypothetical protein|nr:hypothetical protein [Acidimicrobiaceae bacterium]